MKKVNVMLMVVLSLVMMQVAGATTYFSEDFEDETADSALSACTPAWYLFKSSDKIGHVGNIGSPLNSMAVKSETWIRSATSMNNPESGMVILEFDAMAPSTSTDSAGFGLWSSGGMDVNGWWYYNRWLVDLRAISDQISAWEPNVTTAGAELHFTEVIDYDNSKIWGTITDSDGTTYESPHYSLNNSKTISELRVYSAGKAGLYVDNIKAWNGVPEPATIGLMLLGLVGLIRRR